MDLSTLTIEQLKALAYDQIVILNQTQANIQIIQAELANREANPPATVPPAAKKVDYNTRERDKV